MELFRSRWLRDEPEFLCSGGGGGGDGGGVGGGAGASAGSGDAAAGPDAGYSGFGGYGGYGANSSGNWGGAFGDFTGDAGQSTNPGGGRGGVAGLSDFTTADYETYAMGFPNYAVTQHDDMPGRSPSPPAGIDTGPLGTPDMTSVNPGTPGTTIGGTPSSEQGDSVTGGRGGGGRGAGTQGGGDSSWGGGGAPSGPGGGGGGVGIGSGGFGSTSGGSNQGTTGGGGGGQGVLDFLGWLLGPGAAQAETRRQGIGILNENEIGRSPWVNSPSGFGTVGRAQGRSNADRLFFEGDFPAAALNPSFLTPEQRAFQERMIRSEMLRRGFREGTTIDPNAPIPGTPYQGPPQFGRNESPVVAPPDLSPIFGPINPAEWHGGRNLMFSGTNIGTTPGPTTGEATGRSSLGHLTLPDARTVVNLPPNARVSPEEFNRQVVGVPRGDNPINAVVQDNRSGRSVSPFRGASREQSDLVPAPDDELVPTPIARPAPPDRATPEETARDFGERGARGGFRSPTGQITPGGRPAPGPNPLADEIMGRNRTPTTNDPLGPWPVEFDFDPSGAGNAVQFIGSLYRQAGGAGVSSNSAYEAAEELQRQFQALGIQPTDDPNSVAALTMQHYGATPMEMAANVMSGRGSFIEMSPQSADLWRAQGAVIGEWEPGLGTTGLGPDLYEYENRPGARLGMPLIDQFSGVRSREDYDRQLRSFTDPGEGEGVQFYTQGRFNPEGLIVGSPGDASSLLDLGYNRTGQILGGSLTFEGLQQGGTGEDFNIDTGLSGPARTLRLNDDGTALMSLNSGDYQRNLTPREMAMMGISFV